MKRIHWIDVSKGIAMLLIVLGHVLRYGDIRNIVYAFHVPYFFFLSGITAKTELSKEQLCKDARKLLIPYYVFGFVSIAIYGLLGALARSSLDVGGASSIQENIARLLYGSSVLPFNAPLWFLPCLFVMKQWDRILNQVLKRNLPAMICIVIAGSFLSFLYTKAKYVPLPFSFELMLKLYPFYLFGRLAAGKLTKIGPLNQQGYRYLFSGLSLSLLVIVLGSAAPPVNYTNNSISAPLLFYGVAAIGGGALFCYSVFFQKASWLSFIGQNTLPLLTMHKFPIVFFQIVGPFSVFLREPNTLSGLFLGGIPVTILAIVMSLAAGYVLEAFFPFSLGIYGKTHI